MQILKFKNSEAGTSKQVKRKHLSVGDKVLVIDEVGKKHHKVQLWKIFQTFSCLFLFT